jgi:multidrug efflux system outer membrane protein
LANQTAKTFYDLIARRNNLQALEASMSLAADQLARSRAARQSGYVGELDFLSASLSAERARLAYNRARSDYRFALGDFLAALGLEENAGEEAYTLTGELVIVRLDLDTERLINEGLKRRPDLLALRNEAERLKNARNESFLSAKGPQVNLSASWGASLENGFDDTASAGISVTIPVDPWIPRSTKDQAVRQARTNYEKALLDLEDRERNARREIENAAESLRNTWAEVEIARLQNDYARRAFELASDAYRRGTMNFLDYEQIRNNQNDARQQLLQSELNYRILALDLALSLNMEAEELADYAYVRTGEESDGER